MTWSSVIVGTFANANGVYVGPDGQPVDRDGNPIGPAGTGIDNEGYIADPDGTRYTPQGTILNEDNLPEGVVVGPDGVPRTADGDPIGPRGTTISEDGSIVDSTGVSLNVFDLKPLQHAVQSRASLQCIVVFPVLYWQLQRCSSAVNMIFMTCRSTSPTRPNKSHSGGK